MHLGSLGVAMIGLLLTGRALAFSPVEVPANAWTALQVKGDGPQYGGLPGKRGWIQVAYDSASHKVMMFGGDADTYLSDLWEYDFTRNHWHLIRSHPDQEGPCRRDNHNLVYDAAGRRLWMWNGAIGDNTGRNAQPGCAQYENRQDQWTLDSESKAWTRQGKSSERMLASGAGYDPISRTILQFGGDHGLSSNTTSWSFLLDTASGRWTRLSGGAAPPPSTNIQGALVYMSNVRKFLLFGGRNGAGSKTANDQTWTFDPAKRKWERVEVARGPAARDLHSMVYDTVNGVVILRGGRSADRSTVLADTWIFDARTAAWTDLTPVLADPGPPMHYGSAVYDEANQVMLMIPGQWSRDIYALRYRPDLLGTVAR